MSAIEMLQQPTQKGSLPSLSLVCVFHFLRAKSDSSPPGQAYIGGSFVGLHAVGHAHLSDMVVLALSPSRVEQLVRRDWTTMNPVVGFKMLSPALLCILEAHS